MSRYVLGQLTEVTVAMLRESWSGLVKFAVNLFLIQSFMSGFFKIKCSDSKAPLLLMFFFAKFMIGLFYVVIFIFIEGISIVNQM